MAWYRRTKKRRKKRVMGTATGVAASKTVRTYAQSSTDNNFQTKKVVMPMGIVGVNLTQVEREIPADEPPPLPINAELSVIGKPVQRLDARMKVTGKARYTSDIRLPGMLFGREALSVHAHARVRSVDTSRAEKYPGVKAVHVFETVTRYAHEREPDHFNSRESKDREELPTVRFVGQPIAAVAATSQEAADAAVALIQIDYEPLPHVCDLDAARQPDAPPVFPFPVNQEGTGGGEVSPNDLPQEGNVRGPNTGGESNGPRGDIQQGFAEADTIVEGEYRTQVQTHCQLETHAIVADWQPEMLTVYLSTQGVTRAQDEIAEVFDLPKSRVRVICEYMGGGFGAKWGIANFGRAAIELSRRANTPVRVMLERRTQHIAMGNRPGTLQQLRLGAKRDGTLTAIQLTAYGTAGVGLGAGVGSVAGKMYECPNFVQEQYDVLTNAGAGAAFRGPGAAQGLFALEQALDELAYNLELDPITLRDRIDAHAMRREQRLRGAERIGWNRRTAAGVGLEGSTDTLKRGIGMAQSEWGRYVNLNSTCEVVIRRDGSIEVRSGVQDLGTGIRTLLAQIAAEELGLQPTDITVRIGDSMFPAGPGSGGSTTTPSITPAVRNAAYRAKQQLFRQIAPTLNVGVDELEMRDGYVTISNSEERLSFQEAVRQLRTEQIITTATRPDDYGGFQNPASNGSGVTIGKIGGVQFAEVTVDIELGRVYVDRVVAVHDCGRPINPLQIESQINGGVIQGISWALYENRRLDANSGVQVNAGLQFYKIAGAKEIPQIDVMTIEEYVGRSSTDAIGVAEPANIATAAAIANAVYNATGARMYQLPMTPKQVLSALAKVRNRA